MTVPRDPSNDETVSDTHTEDVRPIDSTPLRSLEFKERYVPTDSLGKGGMGIVMSVRDEQIGREIAIKRLLSTRRNNPMVRARFEREVRVQAQLEHPAIVPVYDLGTDADGDLWFTMKKIRGVTLGRVIAQLRDGDAGAKARFSRRRLLTAFANVCLAIEFAHARGVVHRDLKPDNVMLGDFGEVYVLDWGIARIEGVSDEELGKAVELLDTAPGTAVGEILGTIGYMPPEQLTAKGTITPLTDVWALGAVLFELLALTPMMPRTSLAEAIAAADSDDSAHDTAEARTPSLRSPDQDIPPALDAIAVRATEPHPGDRYRSARALHDDVMAYLDGDLEAQRRSLRSAEHVERAREAEAELPPRRSVAMQEINKALALDPTNEQARHAMVRMMIEPPSELPREALAELGRDRAAETRVGFRVGALGFLAMYLFLPVYLWMGIRDWTTTAAVMVLIAVCSGLLWWGSRVPAHARVAMLFTIVTAGVLIACLTRVVGPLASAPMLTFLMAVGLVFNPTGMRIMSVTVLVAISLVAPLLLELAGVLDPSYTFAHGTIVVHPHMTGLSPAATMISMTMTCVSCIAFAALFLIRVHAQLRESQDRVLAYSWNLRQFLPTI